VAREQLELRGELITKPLMFPGSKLALNIVSRGGTRVEVQDASGRPAPGFALKDCAPITGDSLDHRVSWKGGGLFELAGGPVRLRFELNDADLFALQFQTGSWNMRFSADHRFPSDRPLEPEWPRHRAGGARAR
jgi:hypothetical protein